MKLRIAATYARGLGFADVMLPRDLVRGHTTQPLDDTVLLRLRQGADPDDVADRIDALVTPEQDVQVLTRPQYLDNLGSEAADRNLEVYLLLGVIVLFCGLATVNGLGMAISQRSAEFARLRLLGASRRQVIRMVRTESLIIVLFGTAVGARSRRRRWPCSATASLETSCPRRLPRCTPEPGPRFSWSG